jgi:hypothetical protein
MTIWPNKVKVVPVSTTAKPVTVVAETAVKKASMMGIGLTVEIGKDKRKDPITITVKNPNNKIWGGVNFTGLLKK